MPIENLVIVDLDSGATVWVSALSIYIRQAIVESAKRKFPDVAPEPFRKPVEDAVEGFTVPLMEIPEYRRAQVEVLSQRNQYTNQRAVLYSVVGAPDKDELIAHYAPRVRMMQEDGVLPDDPWQATVLGALVRTTSDINKIMAVANESEPLTEVEITDSVRLFRIALPGAISSRSDKGKTASGTPGTVVPDP